MHIAARVLASSLHCTYMADVVMSTGRPIEKCNCLILTSPYMQLPGHLTSSSKCRMQKLAHMQVLTEGDAFTMAFHDPVDAIAWALDVQHRLLDLPWPAELLTQADAKEQFSPSFMPLKRLLFKGLRVRMAMHTGKPEAIQVKLDLSHIRMTVVQSG